MVVIIGVALAGIVWAAEDAAAMVRKKLSVAGANDEWIPVGVEVQPGDILLISANGKVHVGSWTGEVGPDGSTGKGLGRLELKVGTGSPVPTGASLFFKATTAGPVKVRVYDTKYDDNKGEFQVEVIRIPAQMVPPAEDVKM